MKWFLARITAFLSTYYANMVQYRSELFLWALSGSLPIIIMGVWIKASASGKFGLAPTDFARYFLSVFIVRQLTLAWVIWEFEKEVVQGKLSFRLLQPLDPVWHHVAMHLAERLARLPLTFVLIGLFFWLYPQSFWLPSWRQFALFSLAIALAAMLRFLIQYTFAMFAFWTERASAIEQFWFLFFVFLSGYIAPLSIFPPNLREIIQWTPFPYLIYFPASILVGLPVDFWRGVLTILGWGMVFFVLNRWLWRKGLRQYSAMGA